MKAEDAIRYLVHEAELCRDRDTHEAFVLLLPALSKVLGLQPMNDFDAMIFERDLLQHLQRLPSSKKSENPKE